MKLLAEANADVYCFSTFFYPKLKDFGFQAVSRWTKETDLFSKRLLLIPVHLGSHWGLASMNTLQQHITYYDSMHGKMQPVWKHWKSMLLIYRNHQTMLLLLNGIVLPVQMFLN